MRVLISRGKPAPIKVPMTVESHNSKTDCNDTERIREERLLAKFVDQIENMQRKTAQFNDAARSADLFANVDREDQDNDLLRKFFDEIDRDRPYCDTSSCINPVLEGPKNDSLDAGLSQVSNNVSQSEMDFNRLTYAKENSKQSTWSAYEMGFDAQQNLARPSGRLPFLNNQAEEQRLLMLELQKQLHNFTVMIQQQQYRQKLGKKEMREMQAQTAPESAVKEAESMRMQTENAETEIVSTNNSPSVCVSNQQNPVGGLESALQCNQKRTITRSNDKVAVDAEQARHLKNNSQHSGQTNRVDKPDGSLRKKKQVRANIRVQIRDFAAEKNSDVRRKSTTHSCAECGRAFTEKGNLIAHLRIHSGEKPFKCGECGSSFSQKNNLAVHKGIHTGAKPFECRICNVAFSHKSSLSRHLLIHTNEKPFICDICNTEFRHKPTLSDHMNIHSRKWPHKCNVCQKTFRHRQNLSSHRKVHAEEKE